MKAFHTKYSLEQRQEKSKKQIQDNPGKLPLIAEPHPKSTLPTLQNPKFLCESDYKFNAVSSILKKKVDKLKAQSDKEGSKKQTIQSIYDRLKHKDGFLYITYGQMETFGGSKFNKNKL